MESEEATLPSIVVPGPELREKIDKFAGRLCKRDKRDAGEMIAKVLASPKRNAFLFLDTSHIFYPYFLSKLSEYRQNPERAPEAAAEKGQAGTNNVAAATPGAGADAGSAAAAGATTTVRVDGYVRTEGGTRAPQNDPEREELLRQTELEARRYLKDPFPNLYSLDLRGGTLDVPAMLMDIITCTAQYTAKYGEPFLAAVRSRQQHNPHFRFLHTDDVRHCVFKGLVASYKRILAADAESTETRLEELQRPEHLLDTVCAEKAKYAKAALARRKAALLTDDELRSRLHWATFKVLKSFTLSDLMLDGPMPERRATAALPTAPAVPPAQPMAAPQPTPSEDPTAPPARVDVTSVRPTTIQPPGGAPTFTPVFMSASLVASPAGGREDRHARGRRGPPVQLTVLEDYQPRAVAPARRGVDYFQDAETGERFRAEDVQSSAAGGAGGGGGGERAVELKRDRESYGLASEEDMARELKRRAGGQ